MTRKMTFASALAMSLVLGAPGVALAADQDRGNGNGRGQEAQAEHDRGNGNRGNGQGEAHQDDRASQATRGNSNRANGSQDQGRAQIRRDREDDRRPEPVTVRRPDRSEPSTPPFHDGDGNPGLIDGCPPGLAKKNNGCLPPGQARQIQDARWDRYDSYWTRWDSQDGDRYRYRYNDGYLYRYDSGGSLQGWLPVLGGALGLGNVWPQQYGYQPPPQYYSSYYRLNDSYNYRYADGVLYGVDPQTQAIRQVAALLTGQSWNVGEAMPSGYDVYNVPYAYRSQYRDTPQSIYRYSDGYVYQVDPTTRLVQAVIQLLT